MVTFAKEFGENVAARLPILYGGSVKADNARELFSQPDVDGGLIGGASLEADGFLAIVRAAIPYPCRSRPTSGQRRGRGRTIDEQSGRPAHHLIVADQHDPSGLSLPLSPWLPA